MKGLRHFLLSSLTLLFFIPVTSISQGATPAPVISEVQGTILDKSSISIRGANFGIDGPAILLFDDYEKGNSGKTISTAQGSAQVGQWSAAIGSITYSTAYAHSGTKAAQSEWAAAGSGNIPQGQLNFPASHRVFISWWQYLPSGRDIPGTNNADGPNWKLFWLWSDPFPGSDYLTVLLGPSTYAMAGDDINGPRRSYNPAYIKTRFARGAWIRYQLYLQAGQTDGAIEYAELAGSGLATIIDATRLNTTRSGRLWDRLTIPGYGRKDANSQTYVDDVYVAGGPGARARVEIGNRQTYERCTKLALTTPTSWSDAAVTTTVRQGDFTPGEPAFLFVIDSNGNVNRGFPVVVGTTARRIVSSSSGETPDRRYP